MVDQPNTNEELFETIIDDSGKKLYLIPCDICGSLFERYITTYRRCKNKITCRSCITKRIGRTLRRRVLDARK